MFHLLMFLILVFCLVWLLYHLLELLVKLPMYIWEALVGLWKDRRAVLASMLRVAALMLFYAGAFWLLFALMEDPPLQYLLWALNACLICHYLADRYLDRQKEKPD